MKIREDVGLSKVDETHLKINKIYENLNELSSWHLPYIQCFVKKNM